MVISLVERFLSLLAKAFAWGCAFRLLCVGLLIVFVIPASLIDQKHYLANVVNFPAVVCIVLLVYELDIIWPMVPLVDHIGWSEGEYPPPPTYLVVLVMLVGTTLQGLVVYGVVMLKNAWQARRKAASRKPVGV